MDDKLDEENTETGLRTGEVKSTTVSITLNAFELGVDAIIKLEETLEWPEPISSIDALVKREELAALLTEQILAIAQETVSTLSTHIKSNDLTPARHSSPPTIVRDTNINQQSGSGESIEWKTAVDAFDPTKRVQYVSLKSLPTEALKLKASEFLSNQGFKADSFDVWDERRDAETGKAISSVCNIKVKEAFRDKIPSELCYTDKGGVKAVARAKFNTDGSLYFYWANKQIEAAVKYGAFISLPQDEAATDDN